MFDLIALAMITLSITTGVVLLCAAALDYYKEVPFGNLLWASRPTLARDGYMPVTNRSLGITTPSLFSRIGDALTVVTLTNTLLSDRPTTTQRFYAWVGRLATSVQSFIDEPATAQHEARIVLGNAISVCNQADASVDEVIAYTPPSAMEAQVARYNRAVRDLMDAFDAAER